jgi:hypothetical protein
VRRRYLGNQTSRPDPEPISDFDAVLEFIVIGGPNDRALW